jgi:hypothetical protein
VSGVHLRFKMQAPQDQGLHVHATDDAASDPVHQEAGKILSPTDSNWTKRTTTTAGDGGDSRDHVGHAHDGMDNGYVPGKKKYRFAAIGKVRESSGAIVNNSHVQQGIILLIVINAIMMGIATFEFVWGDPAVNHAFEIVDTVLLVIFTIEVAMQMTYHGFSLFLDGWLVFDLIVIVISWSFSQMQIIRSFRILRALRLLTRVESMRDLVAALLSTMPRMTAITALMSLVFYIFAVMFTQLFKDLPLEDSYFVSLDATLFTLFQIMTLDWAGIARECMEYYTWAWLPFIAFIMISSFIVFNLIIAVICDAVSLIGDHTKEDEEAEAARQEQQKALEMEQQVRTLSRQVFNMARTQQQMEHSMQFLVRQLEVTKMRQDAST